jgi:hypothetical protein
MGLVVLWVWLFFGFVQYFLGAEILSSLVTVRTSSGRGVTSVAPEPTFYAIYVTLIYLVYFVHAWKENKRIKFLSNRVFFLTIFQVLFLAKSSMVILVWLLIFLVYLFSIVSFSINYHNLKRTIMMVFSLPLFFVVGMYYVENIASEGDRFVRLGNRFLNSGMNEIILDASINDRLAHLVLSFYGSYLNYFFPGGISSFENVLIIKGELSSGLFWYGAITNKIMSYFGSAVYELGFLCFPLIAFFVYTIVEFLSKEMAMPMAYRLPLVSALVFFCFLSVPISNPIIMCFLAITVSVNKTVLNGGRFES